MKPDPNKNPHAQALGSLGGLRATPKQKAAARRNGRLGGRPKLTGDERESLAAMRKDPWYKTKAEK